MLDQLDFVQRSYKIGVMEYPFGHLIQGKSTKGSLLNLEISIKKILWDRFETFYSIVKSFSFERSSMDHFVFV